MDVVFGDGSEYWFPLADVAAWAAPAPVPPLPVRIGELVGGGGVE